MLSERRHRVYTTARLFFSPPTLLNSKNVLEFAKTTATSSSAGYCAFKYPTGFSSNNTLLLCVRYINDSSRPIVEHRDADFWGGDFSVGNIGVGSGKEVTAFLAKII